MMNFASKDLTAGRLNALVKMVGGHDNVLAILNGELKFKLLSGVSGVAIATADTLTVPTHPTTDAIAAGGYKWVDKLIAEADFPITQDQFGDWEYKLFHFGGGVSTQAVIDQMKAEGFGPAQTGHTLAFGAAHPEEQREYPIVGLGSVVFVGHRRGVLVLCGGGGQRGLCLGWFDDAWHGASRFLGVRRLGA